MSVVAPEVNASNPTTNLTFKSSGHCRLMAGGAIGLGGAGQWEGTCKDFFKGSHSVAGAAPRSNIILLPPPSDMV